MATDLDPPSKASSYAFAILFGLSTFIHLVQLFISGARFWIVIPVLLGVGMEVGGWVTRLQWSSWFDSRADAQTGLLLIAPTFISATPAICLSVLVSNTTGYKNRLIARRVCIILVVIHIVILAMQIAGAFQEMAGTFEMSDWEQTEREGAWTFVASMVVLSVAILVEFAISVHLTAHLRRNGTVEDSRYVANVGPVEKIGIVWILVLVRNIFRIIELRDGFQSNIRYNSKLFELLDGLPILLSVVSMNAFHPARLLPRPLRNQPADGEEIPMQDKPTVVVAK